MKQSIIMICVVAMLSVGFSVGAFANCGDPYNAKPEVNPTGMSDIYIAVGETYELILNQDQTKFTDDANDTIYYWAAGFNPLWTEHVAEETETVPNGSTWISSLKLIFTPTEYDDQPVPIYLYAWNACSEGWDDATIATITVHVVPNLVVGENIHIDSPNAEEGELYTLTHLYFDAGAYSAYKYVTLKLKDAASSETYFGVEMGSFSADPMNYFGYEDYEDENDYYSYKATILNDPGVNKITIKGRQGFVIGKISLVFSDTDNGP